MYVNTEGISLVHVNTEGISLVHINTEGVSLVNVNTEEISLLSVSCPSANIFGDIFVTSRSIKLKQTLLTSRF